jgi:type II secretory pathway pseudopilin PulG
MNLAKLRPEVQRTLAIAVPAAVLLLAAILILPKLFGIYTTGRMAEAQRLAAEAAARANASDVTDQMKQQFAAWPQTRDEQLAFLKELNRLVSTSGVRLVNYRPPSAAAGNVTINTAAGSALLIKPLTTEVTVSGAYPDLMALFSALSRTRRLFAVENLQVRKESYPRLSASFRLVRYVIPSEMVEAPGQTPGIGGIGS